MNTSLEHSYKPLATLNAKTIAAINEPIAGRPVVNSVEELIEALLADTSPPDDPATTTQPP